MSAMPDVTDVQRIRLRRGEKLAVTLPSVPGSLDEMTFMAESVAAAFGIDTDRVVLLDPGTQLTVWEPDEAS